MDLLVEIILELVLEGSVEGATNNKLPKWARIGLLVLATLVYFAIMVVFIWLIVEADNVPARVILGVVVMFCIVAYGLCASGKIICLERGRYQEYRQLYFCLAEL